MKIRKYSDRITLWINHKSLTLVDFYFYKPRVILHLIWFLILFASLFLWWFSAASWFITIFKISPEMWTIGIILIFWKVTHNLLIKLATK